MLQQARFDGFLSLLLTQALCLRLGQATRHGIERAEGWRRQGAQANLAIDITHIQAACFERSVLA
mgnify:CR=1 FL=1